MKCLLYEKVGPSDGLFPELITYTSERSSYQEKKFKMKTGECKLTNSSPIKVKDDDGRDDF